MKGFLSYNKLSDMGITSDNVYISEKVGIYTDELTIGHDVRIDDHVILTGNIRIGNHVHIAAGCYLYGSGGLDIGDYANIAARTTILTASDDFSGAFMIGPTIPDKYRSVRRAPVFIGDHAIIGAGAVILPGSQVLEGTAIGAMSMVNKIVGPWGIFAGVPVKYIKPRLRDCSEMSLYLGGVA